jgi:hypothetical protein
LSLKFWLGWNWFSLSLLVVWWARSAVVDVGMQRPHETTDEMQESGSKYTRPHARYPEKILVSSSIRSPKCNFYKKKKCIKNKVKLWLMTNHVSDKYRHVTFVALLLDTLVFNNIRAFWHSYTSKWRRSCWANICTISWYQHHKNGEVAPEIEHYPRRLGNSFRNIF